MSMSGVGDNKKDDIKGLDDMASDDTVKLVSQEEEKFTVTRKVALMSELATAPFPTGYLPRSERKVPNCGGGCNASGCSGPRATSTSTVVPSSPSSTAPEGWSRCTAASSTGTPNRPARPPLPAGAAPRVSEPGRLGRWRVVLCESLLDASSFWCAGFRNVTAAYGTAVFGDDHRAAFAQHRVQRCLIAYDHDDAGDAAADKLAAELTGTGTECLRVVFPGAPTPTTSPPAAMTPAMSSAVTWPRPAGWEGHRQRWQVPRTWPSAPGAVAEVPRAPAPCPAGEPLSAPAVVVAHDELVVELGGHRWRVRHIPKAPTPGALRVNLMVGVGERFHVDTVDLYAARQREPSPRRRPKSCAARREQLKEELGRALLAVEDAQAAAAAPVEAGPAPMSAAEREAALELLCSPELLEKVVGAFGALGVVGEREAALAAWLTLTSRLSDRPLGAVVQSSSAAGKSTLADAALSLLPPEAKVAYSAMTGQALYYLGAADLAHKVLAIAEEEGASRASYPLKLLVSEGRLSIAAAGKDPATGRLVTHTYEVAGPVALLMTTTSAELDDELANRLLVLAVDEGRAQTRAVHAAQRAAETLDGLVMRTERAQVMALHANVQRLLAPVAVVNPHAPGLSFSDRSTRARRDNAKYLGLVRAVALAHQHQRERKQVIVGGKAVTYIEATPSDVAAVDRLCASVLGSTADEMSPATRKLLEALSAFVASRGQASFTRRELREATGLGDSQLKVHLARLVDLEHVVAERAGRYTTYELAAAASEDTSLRHHRPERLIGRAGTAIGRPSAGSRARTKSSLLAAATTLLRPIGRLPAG